MTIYSGFTHERWLMMVTSGKRLPSTMKNPPMLFMGKSQKKLNELGHGFNSELLLYQNKTYEYYSLPYAYPIINV